MAEPIAEVWVWVVNDPQQHVAGTSLNGAGSAIHDILVRGVTDESIAASEGMFSLWMQDKTLGRYEWKGYTLQRLPLATPEMVRVVEAALRLEALRLGNRPAGVSSIDWLTETTPAYQGAVDEHIAATRALKAARAAGGTDG